MSVPPRPVFGTLNPNHEFKTKQLLFLSKSQHPHPEPNQGVLKGTESRKKMHPVTHSRNLQKPSVRLYKLKGDWDQIQKEDSFFKQNMSSNQTDSNFYHSHRPNNDEDTHAERDEREEQYSQNINLIIGDRGRSIIPPPSKVLFPPQGSVTFSDHDQSPTLMGHLPQAPIQGEEGLQTGRGFARSTVTEIPEPHAGSGSYQLMSAAVHEPHLHIGSPSFNATMKVGGTRPTPNLGSSFRPKIPEEGNPTKSITVKMRQDEIRNGMASGQGSIHPKGIDATLISSHENNSLENKSFDSTNIWLPNRQPDTRVSGGLPPKQAIIEDQNERDQQLTLPSREIKTKLRASRESYQRHTFHSPSKADKGSSAMQLPDMNDGPTEVQQKEEVINSRLNIQSPPTSQNSPSQKARFKPQQNQMLSFDMPNMQADATSSTIMRSQTAALQPHLHQNPNSLEVHQKNIDRDLQSGIEGSNRSPLPPSYQIQQPSSKLPVLKLDSKPDGMVTQQQQQPPKMQNSSFQPSPLQGTSPWPQSTKASNYHIGLNSFGFHNQQIRNLNQSTIHKQDPLHQTIQYDRPAFGGGHGSKAILTHHHIRDALRQTHSTIERSNDPFKSKGVHLQKQLRNLHKLSESVDFTQGHRLLQERTLPSPSDHGMFGEQNYVSPTTATISPVNNRHAAQGMSPDPSAIGDFKVQLQNDSFPSMSKAHLTGDQSGHIKVAASIDWKTSNKLVDHTTTGITLSKGSIDFPQIEKAYLKKQKKANVFPGVRDSNLKLLQTKHQWSWSSALHDQQSIGRQNSKSTLKAILTNTSKDEGKVKEVEDATLDTLITHGDLGGSLKKKLFNLESFKMKFDEMTGQVLNPLKPHSKMKKTSEKKDPEEELTYRQRQKRAKEIRRDRRREERAMRKQMKEKEKEFKKMIRQMGMADQVSSSSSDTVYPPSMSSDNVSDDMNPFLQNFSLQSIDSKRFNKSPKKIREEKLKAEEEERKKLSDKLSKFKEEQQKKEAAAGIKIPRLSLHIDAKRPSQQEAIRPIIISSGGDPSHPRASVIGATPGALQQIMIHQSIKDESEDKQSIIEDIRPNELQPVQEGSFENLKILSTEHDSWPIDLNDLAGHNFLPQLSVDRSMDSFGERLPPELLATLNSFKYFRELETMKEINNTINAFNLKDHSSKMIKHLKGKKLGFILKKYMPEALESHRSALSKSVDVSSHVSSTALPSTSRFERSPVIEDLKASLLQAQSSATRLDKATFKSPKIRNEFIKARQNQEVSQIMSTRKTLNYRKRATIALQENQELSSITGLNSSVTGLDSQVHHSGRAETINQKSLSVLNSPLRPSKNTGTLQIPDISNGVASNTRKSKMTTIEPSPRPSENIKTGIFRMSEHKQSPSRIHSLFANAINDAMIESNQVSKEKIDERSLSEDYDSDLGYEEVVERYERAHLRNIEDPQERIEYYYLSKNVPRVIKMIDHIIHYKMEKQKAEEKKQSALPARERRKKQIGDSKIMDSLIHIHKEMKKKQKLKTPMSSESESVTSDEQPAQKIKTKTKRDPLLCSVEKLALRFLYKIYSEDPRYQIEPDERARTKIAPRDLLSMKEKGEKDYYPETPKEAMIARRTHISCGDHGDLKADKAALTESLFQKFSDFYNDLLDDKHNKVSEQTLVQNLLEVVMDPSNSQFEGLRKKILEGGHQDDMDFSKLREMNPEIFLKEEKKEDLKMGDPGIPQEAMDPKTHHMYSFNPNKRVLAHKTVMNTLVKGIIEQDFPDEKPPTPKRRITNKLLEKNLQQRHFNQKQRKLIRKLSKQQVNLQSKQKKSPLPSSKGLLLNSMKATLLKNFDKNLGNYVHFQKAAQHDQKQRLSAATLNQMINQDLSSLVQKKRDPAQAVKLGNTGVSFRSSMPRVKMSVAQTEEEELIRSSIQQEIFRVEQMKREFFTQQKQLLTNPIGLDTIPKKFYEDLKAKSILIIPEFAKISNYTFCLQNRRISSDMLEAITNYIIAQTKLFHFETDTRKWEPFEKEKGQASPMLCNREPTQPEPDQVIIRNLIIDDSNLKDEELALLLGAIGFQDQLKSLTLANCSFGPKSLLVLCEFITRKDSKINEHHRLESLSFTNVKTDQILLIKLLEILDEEVQTHPLKRLRLRGMDLNHYSIVYYLSNQFYLNPGLLEFDISNSRMLAHHVLTLLEQLATEYTPDGGGASNMKLQFLGLAFLTIGAEIPECPEASQDKEESSCESEQPTSEEKPEATCFCEGCDRQVKSEIVEFIGTIIENAVYLLHLDLSGLALRHHVKPIVASLKKQDPPSLASLHLSDNSFSLKQKDFIMKELGIETHGYHRLFQSSNLLDVNQIDHIQTELSFSQREKTLRKAKEFFSLSHASPAKIKDPALRTSLAKNYLLASIFNHEITSHVRTQKNQLASSSAGVARQAHTNDSFVLSRKLGHPELIFNEQKYHQLEFSVINSEGKWAFSNSPTCEDCYVCQRHSYMQIFFRRSRAELDFEEVTDPQAIQMLTQTYGLDEDDKYHRGAPVLISSANNWLLTRFIDVQIFAQLLKGDDDEFIQKKVQQHIDELRAEEDKAKKKKMKMMVEPDTGEKYDRSSSKVRTTTESDEDISQQTLLGRKKPQEVKFDEDEIMKVETERIKERSKNIRDLIAGSQKGYQKIIGIDNPGPLTLINPRISLGNNAGGHGRKGIILPSAEGPEPELFDISAAREWREVVNQCQKYRQELVSINFPPIDGHDDDVFIFAGFVRPGRHLLFIYDQGRFFQREIVVEVRTSEIKIQKLKFVEPV